MPFRRPFGVIGQKELVETAVFLELSGKIAVLSCLKQDTGRTKSVGNTVEKPLQYMDSPCLYLP